MKFPLYSLKIHNTKIRNSLNVDFVMYYMFKRNDQTGFLKKERNKKNTKSIEQFVWWFGKNTLNLT